MKATAFQATLFESFSRSAGARIVATELFDQLLRAVNNPFTTSDPRLAVKTRSDVCSSIQKLKSLWRRMTTSFVDCGRPSIDIHYDPQGYSAAVFAT